MIFFFFFFLAEIILKDRFYLRTYYPLVECSYILQMDQINNIFKIICSLFKKCKQLRLKRRNNLRTNEIWNNARVKSDL